MEKKSAQCLRHTFLMLDLFLTDFSYFCSIRSSTPVKPTTSASSVVSSSSTMRPPTPSTSVSLPYIRVSGTSGPLRPPSRAGSGALYTPSPGLPPPPPLLQGPANSAASGSLNKQCCQSSWVYLTISL